MFLNGTAHTIRMYTKSYVQAEKGTLETSFEIRGMVPVCSEQG